MTALAATLQPWLRRALALGYFVGVFWLGTTDIGPLPLDERLPTDKLGHMAAFGGMVWIVELALLEWRAGRRRLCALVVSASTGGLLELVQAALPHRSADVGDWIADLLGAVMAVGLSLGFVRLFSERRRSANRAAPGI